MPDMRDAIAQYLASGRPPLGTRGQGITGYGNYTPPPMQQMPPPPPPPSGGVPANLQGYQQLPSGQFMPNDGGGMPMPGGGLGGGEGYPTPPIDTPYIEPPIDTPMQTPSMQGPMMTGPPQGMPGMDMRPDLTTPANGSQNAFGPPMPNLQANPAGGFMPPTEGAPVPPMQPGPPPGFGQPIR